MLVSVLTVKSPLGGKETTERKMQEGDALKGKCRKWRKKVGGRKQEKDGER